MAEMCIYTRSDGLLEPRSTAAFNWLKSLPPGSMLVGSFDKDNRSSLQNRYLWGWVYSKQICDKLAEAGITLPGGIPWTKDSVHAAFQNCFLVKMEFDLDGQTHRIYESTAKMSKKRFTEYVDDQIKPFVRDMWNIEIEDPRDGFYRDLLREINR